SLVGGRIHWSTTSARIASSNTYVSANNDSVWFSAGNASFSAGTGGITQFTGTDHRFYVNGGTIDFFGYSESGSGYGKWLAYHQPSVHNNAPYLEGANQGVGIVFGNRRIYVADNVGNRRDLTCRDLQYQTLSPPSSTRETKKNITDVPFDSLRVIQDNPAYEWEYRDPDHGGRHIGPMADDLPEPVKVENETGTTIELGSIVGTMWDAIGKIAERLDDISE